MDNKFFYLIVLLIYLENFNSFGEDICKNEPRCVVRRTHKMKSVDCFHKEFRTFPKCIPSDAEILELSVNRIKKVSRADLSQFGSLKLLYLKENLLATLQNDTFEDMDDLITIDLSQNNLKLIPTSVFKLPSLKKLYISQNEELNMAASIDRVKPVESPISMIDMSSTTEEYSLLEFPDFGTMPYLESLNISENQYQTLTPKHFAGLCNLQMLININVSNKYEDGCDCWVINKWLTQRKVKFTTFLCPVTEDDCLNKKVSEEDKVTYNKCLEVVDAIKKEHLLAKVFIGLGVSALVIVIVLCSVYFCFLKNRRIRNNNNKDKKSAPLDVQPDGPLLLHNELKAAVAKM